MSQVRMIDVSANNHPDNGPIDWKKVAKSDIGAVMVKSSEGVTYVNPWLVRDATGAKAAGLLVGFYHFRHPGLATPQTEARHACVAVTGLHHDLGLAQDLEVAEGKAWAELAAQAKIFHAEVRKSFRHSPLYINDYFLGNLPGAPFAERLWVAQTARPRFECWAWQETTPAEVPGIVGAVDVSWLHPAR